jgi:hypothetical protein
VLYTAAYRTAKDPRNSTQNEGNYHAYTKLKADGEEKLARDKS